MAVFHEEFHFQCIYSEYFSLLLPWTFLGFSFRIQKWCGNAGIARARRRALASECFTSEMRLRITEPASFKKKYRRFSDENSLFLLWRKAPNHYLLNTLLPYELLWVARSEGITQGGNHSQTGESCVEERNRTQQCFQASDDEWTLRGTQASHRPGRAVFGVHI